MKKMKIMAYALAMCFSVALVSCGTGPDNAENELQEETKPNPGAQTDAKMTNPTTPGRQAGEGEAEGGTEEVELTATDPDIGGHEMMPTQLVVENITSNYELSTLAAALRRAELVDALNATGPYTVFAPENDAFEALPDGVLEELMQPENKARLKEILNNHVVAGRLTVSELKDGATLKTVGGEQLKVSKKGEKVMINGAEVLQPNVESENGVIHVIGKVLITKK
ncbi:fasciclin domain-containing protein [Pontibacter actiniarum]|uniref:FAS1 domain-containing protein n=1 Tax=Pontibacter actiniarum TaxID=323450 RepID=A0A1X9YMB3_9BACT|nr:fasciclin domain-containing protein [Pontibacter actiniarum]ARS34010.1 hypothetical protein CA264_00350 [Pontibacter actiniarum]